MSELIQAQPLKDVARPTLFHPDLNKRNIFVDEHDHTKVTGIIDWQSTSVEPAFMYGAETPDFAKRVDRDADAVDEVEIDEEEVKKEKLRQRNIEICADVFGVCMIGFARIIGRARAVDDMLLRPFRHCNMSWRDSAVPLRDDLIDLSRSWKDLGLPGTCPYQPSDAEVAMLKKDWQDFEIVLRLRSTLADIHGVASDGWVAADAWEQVLPVYREIYEMWIKFARDNEDQDPDMSEEKANKMWPFDQR